MTVYCKNCGANIKLNGGRIVDYLCGNCSITGEVVPFYYIKIFSDMCDKKDNSLGIITGLNEDELVFEVARRINFKSEKFIVYFGKTELKAKAFLKNLVKRIKKYHKIVHEDSYEFWTSRCTVWSRSYTQPIRGCTRGQNRPTLIIYDHVESVNDHIVAIDKLYNTIRQEGLPALQPQRLGGGKLIVLGNKNDNLIKRLINNDNEYI